MGRTNGLSMFNASLLGLAYDRRLKSHQRKGNHSQSNLNNGHIFAVMTDCDSLYVLDDDSFTLKTDQLPVDLQLLPHTPVDF